MQYHTSNLLNMSKYLVVVLVGICCYCCRDSSSFSSHSPPLSSSSSRDVMPIDLWQLPLLSSLSRSSNTSFALRNVVKYRLRDPIVIHPAKMLPPFFSVLLYSQMHCKDVQCFTYVITAKSVQMITLRVHHFTDLKNVVSAAWMRFSSFLVNTQISLRK